MNRKWAIRKFTDNFPGLIKKGKSLKVTDKYFPFKCSDLSVFGSIGKISGMLPIHIDRSQDQSHSGAFYPFHEGMIWNFILSVKGSPALMLGDQRPKIIPLHPGLAIWLDITETFHGITQLCTLHPKEAPEVILAQVSGSPAFLYDSAYCEIKELEQFYTKR